jgi:hypothetical protein
MGGTKMETLISVISKYLAPQFNNNSFEHELPDQHNNAFSAKMFTYIYL